MSMTDIKETISVFIHFDDLEFPLWFLIPGLIGAFVGITRMDLAEESKDWPETKGRIISSEIREETQRPARISGEATQASETIYRAVVSYSYSVDSKPYRADILSFGPTGFSDRKKALALKEKYPPGKTVTVRYKPDNHEMAVIETGWIGFPVMAVVASIFAFLGLSLFSIALFNRFRRLVRGESWSGDD